MADRVEEFLYRGFIPEENRGGNYHVMLLIDGKIEGPFTPDQADVKGWPLSAIMADLNRQTLSALEAEKEKSAMLEAQRDEAAQAFGQARNAIAAMEAHIAALTPKITTKKG